jgi:hypothetical protein
MLKITCPISGIAWNTTQFSLSKVEILHPVFMLSISELNILHAANMLAPKEQESCLLALAYLQATNLVQFNSACDALQWQVAYSALPRLQEFVQFLHSNERNIAYWQSTLEYEGYQHKLFASFTLCNDNINTLPNLLDTWDSNIADYANHYRKSRIDSQQALKRELLQHAIALRARNPERFGKRLAQWANSYCTFPHATHEVQGKQVSYSEYWQYIIVCCATRKRDTRLYLIQQDDIQLLLDYLLDVAIIHNPHPLDMNDTNSFILIELLQDALKDFSWIGCTDYEIQIATNTKSEYSAIGIMEEPIRAAFPTELGYIRAMAKYKAAISIQNGVI